MTGEWIFRTLFLTLLVGLLTMRVFFMIRVRRSGGRILPGKQAVVREGGILFLVLRVAVFIALITLLVMYFKGSAWMDLFSVLLPGWLRWAGFLLGMISEMLWTWAQVELDTQWSAQLQLTKNHTLVITGPYQWVHHPLYTAMFGWCVAVSLLTAHGFFITLSVLSMVMLIVRVQKEEAMMLEAFGEQYVLYMQQTGRFLPRIFRKQTD